MREGWEIKKLADLCKTFADGDWIEKKDQSPSGIRLVQTGNVGNGVFRGKDDSRHYISQETFERLHCTEIFPGDILISRLPEPVGRGCLIPKTGEKMITAVDCTIIRLNSGCLPQFLVYYSQSAEYQHSVREVSTGTTRQRISRKNLGEIGIPVPSLPEQQRIVDILDREFAKIDALKANAEKSLQAAKDLFQAALTHYFSGGNVMLGDILNLHRGYDLTHSEMADGPIPVAGSGGIIGYHNVATPISPCITIGRSGSVGKVFVYETCWAHNTSLYVDDFKGNNPFYLVYLLKSLDLPSFGGGSAVPTLNRNVLHPIVVGYTPDKIEQERIVLKLDDLNDRCNTLKENYHKTLTLCDDLKQSLLRKAFNGEL